MNDSILVIGGSSGIGASIVAQLAARDQPSIAASRSAEEVGEAGAIAISWDATAGPLPADRLPDRLSGLVYCPGSIVLKPFQRLTDEDFEADFELNLLGAVRAVRAALPALRRSSSGSASVVLFSTVAVSLGFPFHASIAAAKGAVEGLTRSLAAELAPSIRVNAIAPSLTDTPLVGRLLATEKRRHDAADQHPLRRIGRPEEVARLAVSLLTGDLSWSTGQIFHLDGGLSAVRPG